MQPTLSRISGSTRGFSTTDPERQGVLGHAVPRNPPSQSSQRAGMPQAQAMPTRTVGTTVRPGSSTQR